MESSGEHQIQIRESLKELENWYKQGKDRNDAKVKDMEEKIKIALDVPGESWMKTGQTLKDVIENLYKHLDIVQKLTYSAETVSDTDVLKNASGGMALEGIYKTGNAEDLLVKREQLIKIPDFFSLNNSKQNSRYEQKEFSSHKSEKVFQKVMEKLGYSFSMEFSTQFENFSLSSGVQKNKSSETVETSSNSQEESYILQTKYNYIPLASGFFNKRDLKLSNGALNALKEIEKVVLYSDDCQQQTNTIRVFYERYGSHVNQGPLHFGGVFWWKASASGFRRTDFSEVKNLASESLNAYCGYAFGFGPFFNSSKVATSSTQLRGSFSGKYREDLMSQVQLSVSKTGGPAETDDYLQWRIHLATQNKTWSLIDRGITLMPVWEILLASHRDDFDDVSSLSRKLMDTYTEITKVKVEEVWGENIHSQVEKAETLLQSVKGWTAYDCESYLITLLDFKNSLEKTGSHKIWYLKCLSNEILQNYLFDVAKVNNKSTETLRSLMRSLLEPNLYEAVENFPNRKAIVNWAYQTKDVSHVQVPVSEFSDLDRILQCVKKEQEEHRHTFMSAEQEHSANKDMNEVSLLLKSFYKTLGENGQKETELLVLSIVTVLGYNKESNTFNHPLNINEFMFLQSELNRAFNQYSSLQKQCPIRAQAYLLQTALTVSTKKDTTIPPKAKEERLQFIQTQLMNKLSSHIESVIEKCRDDWESLESELHSIIMGEQMTEGSTTVEKALSQLEDILMKSVVFLPDVQTSDEQNTLVNNKEENPSSFMSFLQRLGLQDSYPQKMTKNKALIIDELSLSVKEPKTEKDLSSLYLYKLMMMDYRARHLYVEPERTGLNFEAEGSEYESDDDFFNVDDNHIFNVDESEMVSKQTHIHPMDVEMAIFHCSNDFLRQYIFEKLSACQFSLPFLVPNPCTGNVEFPVWALRHIRKSWHSKIQGVPDTYSKYHNKQMFNAPVSIVSFIRLGDSDFNSKSQILNGVISKQKHNVFFHRHCEGSTPHSLLMNGVVEIAWYCPGGKKDDLFDECVAFLNLRGDAAEHPKQLEFLQAVSTVNVLLLSEHPISETAKKVSEKLSKSSVPLVCLFSSTDKPQQSKTPTKVKLAAKNRNQAELTNELISSIKHCISENKQTVTIEQCCEEARKQQFKIDEDKQSCKEGHAQAQKLMSLLEDVNLCNLKKKIFPMQGKLWHDWCKKDKEQNRLQFKENESIEEQLSQILLHMTDIRERQLCAANLHNGFIRSFLDFSTAPSKDTYVYMLQWLTILLDGHTTDTLGLLEEDYNSTWKKMKSAPRDSENKFIVQSLQNKLERITDKMAATKVGLQHILREVGQLYEAIQMCTQERKKTEQWVSTLPSIGVSMLLSGYPLEIMDGDATHVPLTWINAVLDELNKTLGPKNVFVLTILGLQGSGKSTLLNTMFGLQYPVSAGRCTHGAFMQLMEVDSSIRNELGFDLVLIVDTEGLRSPELITKISLNHDNELATFIIGIGDATVINFMGENPSEMQDILQICVQAFLRMKQVKITPSCIFVHQNVTETSARDKNFPGRRRFLEKLDDMARMAAKEENICDISGFSDVIHFDIDTQILYFKNLLEGDAPMAPPNPSYSQNVQDLKIKILASRKKHTFCTLSEFKYRVSDLWTALLKENFVFSFKNTVEMMVYGALESKYGDWSWNLRKYSLSLQTEMENKIGSNLIQSVAIDSLTEKYDNVYKPLKDEMEKYFTEDKNKEILIQWKEFFNKRFKCLKSDLIASTLNKCNELCISKQKRSELDMRKGQYIKELTEQSKHMASTLKTMQLSDEDVKEWFEKVWTNWETSKLKLHVEDVKVKTKVEGILYQRFKTQPGIQEKIKSGIFQLEPRKHIQQSILNKVEKRVIESDVNCFVQQTKEKVACAITTETECRRDFNENYIYQIIASIQTHIHEHEKLSKWSTTPESSIFTHEFSVDLTVHLCLQNVERLQKMHEEFKTANNPLSYFESQKENYFLSFKNYCKGASSVKIFIDFLCKHITPEVLKAGNEGLCQQIADEMKSKNPAFSGNRANLENHILKHLMVQDVFSLYDEYLHSPKVYFERFIKNAVQEYVYNYVNQGFMKTWMQDNLRSLKSQILTASTAISTEVAEKKEKAQTWLDLFCKRIGHLITINRQELNCIKEEDIDDWQYFKDEMTNSLEEMFKDVNVDMKVVIHKPTKKLCQHFQGCWAQCPFCKAICTNTIPNHDGYHSVKFHRCKALAGFYYDGKKQFCLDFCTTLIGSDKRFLSQSENKWVKFKEYKKAGDPYDKWCITADGTGQRYWKWFICTFKSKLEEKYGFQFKGQGQIPEGWEKITKQAAVEELES